MLQFTGIPAAGLKDSSDSNQVRIADNALLQYINQLASNIYPELFRWDSGVSYVTDDVVEYGGSFYAAIANSKGVMPTTTSSWTKLVSFTPTSITISVTLTISGAVTITGLLTAGALKLGAGTTTQAPLTLTAGTNRTSPAAGSMEYDGTDLYFTRVSTRGTISMQRTAGDTTTGSIKYNGTAQAAGQMDGGSTTPSHTNRLNFDGNLFLTNVYLSNPLAIASGGTGNTVMPSLLNDVLLYWPLDDLDKHGTGVVSITPDVSGNGRDGIVRGPGWATVAQGRAGGGAQATDLTTPDIYSASQIVLNESGATISFWRAPSGTVGAYNRPMVCYTNVANGTDGGIGILLDTSNQCYVYVNGGISSLGIVADPNGWHHWVVVYAVGTGVQVYFDGSLLATGPTLSANINLTAYFRVGGSPQGGYPNAYFDEVRFYERALSLAEIQYLYNNPAGLTTGMMSGTQIIHSPVFGGYPEWDGQTRVTSQFDKTSDTSLANITGLSVTVASAASYYFEANLYTSSNASGGIQAAISGTATATAITYDCLTFDAAAVKAQTRATSLGTSVGGVTAVTAAIMKISGTITVNAGGTLTVQFAQNASNGTASSVLVGSTFIVNQVA